MSQSPMFFTLVALATVWASEEARSAHDCPDPQPPAAAVDRCDEVPAACPECPVRHDRDR